METLWTIVLILALTGSSLLAYTLRILDGRGAVASFVLGAIILWAGGLEWFILMVAFTAIAFLATRFGRRRKEDQGTAEARGGERGAPNVFANGGAPALAAVAALIFDPAAAALAYAAAVAAIMSDTLASEIGGLARRARCILPPFQRLEPGTNGAVSWLGQFASILGPTAIAVVAYYAMAIPAKDLPIIVAAGFLGSQLDSMLGAKFEQDAHHPERVFGKGTVNFLASVIPMLAVLLVVLWSPSI